MHKVLKVRLPNPTTSTHHPPPLTFCNTLRYSKSTCALPQGGQNVTQRYPTTSSSHNISPFTNTYSTLFSLAQPYATPTTPFAHVVLYLVIPYFPASQTRAQPYTTPHSTLKHPALLYPLTNVLKCDMGGGGSSTEQLIKVLSHQKKYGFIHLILIPYYTLKHPATP